LASVFFLDGKYLDTAIALKKAEAIAELRQAATLSPSYAEPHYVLGRIYQRKGDTKNAEAAWATFQKLKKEDPKERPH
jgi:Flp pilus assembly protein TadD